jgi:hypothetical protein
MKKGLKACSVVVLVLVVLCAGVMSAVFFFKYCPPRGPWLRPPWCYATALATPTARPIPTPTAVAQFVPSKVDLYGRVYFKQQQDWILNGNVFAFGPIVGSNLDFVHELQSHGARAFSNISTWNSLMAKTPDELPPELKNSYLTDFDGKPIYQQGILFLNIAEPAYQKWIMDSTDKSIDAGIDGITVDEHQGTIQALWTGEGPCDAYSLNGFKDYLKSKYTEAQLKNKGVDQIDTFNYCQYIIDHNYRDLYKNERGKVPFVNDYIHFLYSSSDAALRGLIAHARQYASQKGRTLVFGANWEPLDRLDEAQLYDQLDLFIFEHDWFPTWRNDPGYYKFPAGSPVGPEMKYTVGREKTAVTMFIVQDGRELASQGQTGGTFLVNHQFAESYANRGHYMYSDLENFLGLTFVADRPPMIPYYTFVRQYPEAFTELSQKNELAVLFPPHMNTANPNQKEWSFAVAAALSDANLQYDFVDLDKINNYKVVVANGNAWSDTELDSLLSFVKNGGTVLAYDNSFARLDENYQDKSRPQINNLKVGGTHTLGSGKFIFFNEDMGWQLWAHQKPIEKDKLVEAIEQFTAAEVAPENIQVLPYTSGDRMVVHILNYDFQDRDFSTKQDFRVQIHVPDGFSTSGKALKIISPEFEGEKAVEYQLSDKVITFSVPSLHIWDVAILE